MHEPEPFGVDLKREKIDASRVAARPREARNEAQCHRVLTHTEHKRDRCGCGFNGARSIGTAGRGDRSHATPGQVGEQCRQALVMTLQPVVLDRDILAFGIARFA